VSANDLIQRFGQGRGRLELGALGGLDVELVGRE
jgi:hypothetical protein